MVTQSTEVLVLRHRRLRALLIATICAVGMAGLWPIRDEAGRATVWVAIIFVAGFGTFAGILPLLPGASYLRLDATGFKYCAAFFPVRVAWSEIAEFGVVRKDSAHAYATVGFNFVPGYTKNAAGRELVKSINGWEGALPATYGKRPEELAQLMNEWRQRFNSD
ncbi:hypothetical protein BH10PLA1_BH10PLA1_20750 [soil metagenome]